MRQRKQEDSWREPARVVKRLYSVLSSHNERSNRNLPGLQKYSTILYSHSAGVMREGFAFSFDLNKIQFSLSPSSYMYLFSTCMRHPGYYPEAWRLLSWTMELLAFESRRFAPKVVDLSVRFIRILSERSGRRKPPAERSAL